MNQKQEIFWRFYRSYAITILICLLVVGIATRVFITRFTYNQEVRHLGIMTSTLEPTLRKQLLQLSGVEPSETSFGIYQEPVSADFSHGTEPVVFDYWPSESDMVGIVLRGSSNDDLVPVFTHGNSVQNLVDSLNLERNRSLPLDEDHLIPGSDSGSPFIFDLRKLQVADNTYYFITAIPDSVVSRSSNKAFFIILPAILFGLIASGSVAWYFARSFSTPIDLMRRTAQRFGRGDFSRKVPDFSNFELSDLSDALNTMARLLDGRISEITIERNEKVAILESLNEGVMAIDRNERILSLNNTGAHLLSVNTSEVKGTLVQEFLRQVELQRFIQSSLQGNYTQDDEFPQQIQIGAGRLLEVRSAPLRNHDGRDIGVIIIMVDITRLNKLENLRRDFVANVSHELRTPITSIKGYTETLLDGALDDDPDQVRKFLEVIDRQSNRLGQVIEDLLNLSRLETREEIERDPVTLSGLMRQVIELCQPEADSNGTELILECPQDMSIFLNETLMEQALTNLVLNAIRYAGGEGKAVRVFAILEDDRMRFQVIDKGPGIPEEHLHRLFERFYRVDKARSRDIGGTGLGLSIVKHVATAHHGTVSVESVIDEGASFTIEIPTNGNSTTRMIVNEESV